jgi:nitrate/TMAO reductase-like tetraheme cytochrome c subunit
LCFVVSIYEKTSKDMVLRNFSSYQGGDMEKRLGFLVPFLLLIFLSGISYAQTYTCLVCHSAMKQKIKTEAGEVVNLWIDEERFMNSVHGFASCDTCHKLFSENPHQRPAKTMPPNLGEAFQKIRPKAKVDGVALVACIECHPEVYREYSESIHGKNIMDKKMSDGPSCVDCHGSPHYIVSRNSKDSPVNKWNIVNTCGNCHENEAIAKKYGYGLHIVEKYNESFHGKKYRLGHENAPTCVDCHSYHKVKKWDDPQSPVSMVNRKVTCGKCHKGATDKFVVAITHKPIGKDNPVPYYAEKALMILTISVFAFITVHVVLEIYSEIRDKVFRKKEE